MNAYSEHEDFMKVTSDSNEYYKNEKFWARKKKFKSYSCLLYALKQDFSTC